MENKVDVFICEECGYEDSSFIPFGANVKSENECKAGYINCPDCNKEVNKRIEKLNYEPYMTINELNELLIYINKNHNFKEVKGKMIKYISPTIDFRTGTIFKVVLNNKEFVKVNENRHRNLYAWIMNYLN